MRTTSPLVVVTPTLGTSPYLGECVRSVRAMDVDAMHVIVAPPAAVAALALAYPSSHVMSEGEPTGMYGAVNAGLAAVEGWEWFTYLNDDDVLSPDFAAVATAHMGSGDTTMIGYGNVRWIAGEGQNLGLMPVERDVRHFGPLIAGRLAPIAQQGALTGRAVFESLGGFRSRFRFAGDHDFWTRAFLADVRFRFYDAEVGRFRVHGAQISRNLVRVHAEMEEIAALIPGDRAWWRLRLARVRFQLRNITRYAERFRKTGAFRTSTLYQRHWR